MTQTNHPDERRNVDYLRISDDKKGHGYGVTSQHEENVAMSEEHGRPITKSYEDNDRSAKAKEDGTFAERPDYANLLRDMAADLIAAIFIWHADRLHRNSVEVDAFIRLARKHNVRLFSVSRGGEYRLDTNSGRIALKEDTLRGESEVGHKSERVTLARKRQARQGSFGGGIRRYGWGIDTGRVRTVCENPKEKDLSLRTFRDVPVLDMSKHRPDEAKEIRHWKSELLSGVTMAHVLRDMQERGVKTLREKEGLKTQRQDGKQSRWTAKTVKLILISPRVAGHAEYKGEIVKRNAYDEIITEDERQALISLFNDPSRKTTTGNTPRWLVSVIAKAGCGVCKREETVTVNTKGGGGTPHYRCPGCGTCSQPAVEVDNHVSHAAIARLSRPDLAELVKPTKEIDIEGLRAELTALNGRNRAAAISYGEGRIELSTLETAQATANRRIAEINAALSEVARENPLVDFIGVKDAGAKWDSLSLGRRREIVRLLFDITILPYSGPMGRKPKGWEWDPSISVRIEPKGTS
ncbi:recombinase family protein [Streptomyces sp. AcH 505]|uniref:recombinase family protein n=1 Tax=Streptomyces sp. AcH 505 TaxID=352211 RepID=UPI00099D6523